MSASLVATASSATSRALNIALPAIVIQSSLQSWVASKQGRLIDDFNSFCSKNNADALVVCFLATEPKLARHIVVYSPSPRIASSLVFGPYLPSDSNTSSTVSGTEADTSFAAAAATAGLAGGFAPDTGVFAPSMLGLTPVRLCATGVASRSWDPFHPEEPAQPNCGSVGEDAVLLTTENASNARNLLSAAFPVNSNSSVSLNNELPVLMAFEQAEVAHSRKQVLPLVNAVVKATARVFANGCDV